MAPVEVPPDPVVVVVKQPPRVVIVREVDPVVPDAYKIPPRGPVGPSGMGLPTFVRGGLLAPMTGSGRIYNDTGRALTISRIRASAEVAAIGGPITVDILINGVSIGTLLTLDPPALTTFADVDVEWPVNAAMSVNILTVGTTYPGYTLTVTASAN